VRQPLRPRADYRHWKRITTRWHDNDVYGHVNNTVYYAWFDTAVNDWLIDNGLLALDGDGPIGLVVETGCRYAASVSFPSDVEIGLLIDRLGQSSVTYHLGVFGGGSPDAAAEGHFTHVYVDRVSRRPVPIPETARQRMVETLLAGGTSRG
jgi:acyl-CoA thioester hydrolase